MTKREREKAIKNTGEIIMDIYSHETGKDYQIKKYVHNDKEYFAIRRKELDRTYSYLWDFKSQIDALKSLDD